MLYTQSPISPYGSVNKTDLQKVFQNMMLFLAPLLLVYFLQLNGIVQNRALLWSDLIPAKWTAGAIELYVLNAIVDFLRKFTNPN